MYILSLVTGYMRLISICTLFSASQHMLIPFKAVKSDKISQNPIFHHVLQCYNLNVPVACQNEPFHKKICLSGLKTLSPKKILVFGLENAVVTSGSIIQSYSQQQYWMHLLVFAYCTKHSCNMLSCVAGLLFRVVMKKCTSEIKKNVYEP